MRFVFGRHPELIGWRRNKVLKSMVSIDRRSWARGAGRGQWLRIGDRHEAGVN